MEKTKIVKDFDNKLITIERLFSQSSEKLWSAWTKSENLEKWFAPKPWKAVTKSFDFTDHGQWLYYMESPEGEKHWSLAEYMDIDTGKSFNSIDAFCDEFGTINNELPRLHWHVEFKKTDQGTNLMVSITSEQAAALKKIIEMGFEQGFIMALDNLEEILVD